MSYMQHSNDSSHEFFGTGNLTCWTFFTLPHHILKLKRTTVSETDYSL